MSSKAKSIGVVLYVPKMVDTISKQKVLLLYSYVHSNYLWSAPSLTKPFSVSQLQMSSSTIESVELSASIILYNFDVSSSLKQSSSLIYRKSSTKFRTRSIQSCMSINFLRLLEQRMESSMKERQEMVDLESYRSSDSFWFVIIYRMILTLLE